MSYAKVSPQLRTITVGEVKYRWRFMKRRYDSTLAVYGPDSGYRPLRVTLWGFQDSWAIFPKDKSKELTIMGPKFVAAVIAFGLANGWAPGQPGAPFEVDLSDGELAVRRVNVVAAPVQKPVIPVELPPDAWAQMVAGGKSLSFAVLPVGPKGSRALVHVWRVARAGSGVSSGPPLFCVDVFMSGGSPVGWRLAGSASFLGSTALESLSISTRWLYPLEKEGPVVLLKAKDELGSTVVLVTFPEGLHLGDRTTPSFVQEFYEGYVGGADVDLFYGVQTAGVTRPVMMVAKKVIYHSNHPASWRLFGWSGNGFTREDSSQGELTEGATPKIRLVP